jgi:hypothetical protein
MDAKKAKELVDSAKTAGVDDVERLIELRANAGFSELNYFKTLNQFQVQELKDNGFDVSGPYGGSEGLHLWIQW